MKYIKEIKKSILLTDIIYLFIGFLMAVIPKFISDFICYIMGIIIILFGSNRILKYMELKKKNSLSNILLFIGIIALIIGLVIIVNPKSFASIIPLIIGVYVFVLGITKYNQAINFKEAGYKSWYNVMISAVLLSVLGLIVAFNPFETLTLIIRLVGIAFIINSIYDLYNTYNYSKGFKEFKKDIDKLLK